MAEFSEDGTWARAGRRRDITDGCPWASQGKGMSRAKPAELDSFRWAVLGTVESCGKEEDNSSAAEPRGHYLSQEMISQVTMRIERETCLSGGRRDWPRCQLNECGNSERQGKNNG